MNDYIYLDMSKEYHSPIMIKQGDIGTVKKIVLSRNGSLYDLTNCTVKFYSKKPDGKIVYVNCSIETDATLNKTVIKIEFTNQMLLVAGEMPFELVINKTTTTTNDDNTTTTTTTETSTIPVIINVVASIRYMQDVITESKNEIDVIGSVLQDGSVTKFKLDDDLSDAIDQIIDTEYGETEITLVQAPKTVIRPSTSITTTPWLLELDQNINFKSVYFNVEANKIYTITKTAVTDTFRVAIYEKYATGEEPLQTILEDSSQLTCTFTANFTGVCVAMMSKSGELIKEITSAKRTTVAISHSVKNSIVNDLNRGIDATWEGWNETRWNIGGLTASTCNVPFYTKGIADVKGMIVGGGSHTENRRWGQHVLELYGKDNHQRVTLLLDRRTGDRMEEDNVANTAELYMYLPSDVAGVTAESYGWFRIGSDVAKHSVMFRRDKCLAYAELDLRSAITLARINPTTDLDSSCSTVAEADVKYQPERYPVENAKCIRYIQLKNAENGAMFYDTNRDKVIIKVGGTWCDMNVTPVASGTYNF